MTKIDSARGTGSRLPASRRGLERYYRCIERGRVIQWIDRCRPFEARLAILMLSSAKREHTKN
jgi:hypothetical protein